jgi:cell wall-associated NlpC family hydrolase
MRNRTTITKKGKTPYELFHGHKPDLASAKVFGSTAYVLIDGTRRSKLDPTSKKGTMVGYSSSRKAYRILVDGIVIEHRDVIFDETFQPMGASVSDDDQSAVTQAAPPAAAARGTSGSDQGAEQPLATATPAPEQQPTVTPEAPAAPTHQPVASNAAPEQATRRRSARFAVPEQQQGTAPAATPAERNLRTKYSLRGAPRQRVHSSFMAQVLEQAQAATEDSEDPGSYDEAISGTDAAQWEAAMEEELQSLTDHNTGVLVDRLPGSKVITLKWVFTKKRDAAGQVERYKARLVARGFQQREGLDYDELFAPVGKHTTLRLLLSMVAAEDMELHQLDFKTAFLNGDLAEEIYVEQPPGYRLGKPGQVIRLSKALYGLKQAPRAWHQTLKKELLANGFMESVADPGLFFLHTNTGRACVLIYVDDALVAAHTLEAVLQVKSLLMGMFEARDLGEAGLFLGMAIERNRQQHTIKLHQERAVKDLLAKYNMKHANAKVIPLSPGTKLQKDEGEPLDAEQKHIYSSLVGSLNYLAVCTRPDIAFPVGVLARYLASPTSDHIAAAKGVLRYLAGTTNHGLNYGAKLGDSTIIGYCDADHAGDLDKRRSTTGYTFILNGGSISWSSKRQETVALSTVEAEYMAAASATKEALWLRGLLAELGLPYQTIQIYADNQGAMQLVKNPIVSARSKHIDVRYHFVREHVAKEEVAFHYISTNEMKADSLTKALSGDKHSFCKLGMGVY